jgi:hypothetical protein
MSAMTAHWGGIDRLRKGYGYSYGCFTGYGSGLYRFVGDGTGYTCDNPPGYGYGMSSYMRWGRLRYGDGCLNEPMRS